MLKEKIIYEQNLPCSVLAAEIWEYPIHFHEDMEIVYVLRGSIRLHDVTADCTLRRGDVYIINEQEMHSLKHTGEPNRVMLLSLNLHYFSKYYDNLNNNFFVTDPENENDENIEEIRRLLAQILMETTEKQWGYERTVIESLHSMICCLLENFHYFQLAEGTFRNDSSHRGNRVLARRLKRITDYLYQNYQSRLTLKEIADQEHLSTFYLSHVLRDATGLSFQELLAYIRVEESEKELLGSDRNISEIAERMGFSAVRYYVKHFERWFGMTPSEFRSRYGEAAGHRGSRAIYMQLSEKQIRESVRIQDQRIHADYTGGAENEPVILEIFTEEGGWFWKTDEYLDRILSHEAASVLAAPYREMRQFGDSVFMCRKNAVFSGDHLPAKLPEHFSILIYGCPAGIQNVLEEVRSERELMKILEQNREVSEYLLNFPGMTGEYRITRCHMSRHYFRSRMYDSGFSAEKTARDQFLTRMKTLPEKYQEHCLITESFRLRISFCGIGAEMILFDRIS